MLHHPALCGRAGRQNPHLGGIEAHETEGLPAQDQLRALCPHKGIA
jgi:hypothetical protein